MSHETGRVVGIHVASTQDAPMEALHEARLVEGKGIEGDRYFGKPKAQVTLVAEEHLAAAARDAGTAIGPGATRRNVTLSGVPQALVPGARVRIGDTLVEVLSPADPCKLMDECIAPGARAALEGRSGVRAAVRRGGVIRVGDVVQVEPAGA